MEIAKFNSAAIARQLGSDIVNVEVKPHFGGGEQMTVTLSNGWGLSILSVKVNRGVHGGLYAGEGTFEVATLFNDTLTEIEEDGDVVYGWQTPNDVAALLVKISHLGQNNS
jgi:hypothetical protein